MIHNRVELLPPESGGGGSSGSALETVMKTVPVVIQLKGPGGLKKGLMMAATYAVQSGMATEIATVATEMAASVASSSWKGLKRYAADLAKGTDQKKKRELLHIVDAVEECGKRGLCNVELPPGSNMSGVELVDILDKLDILKEAMGISIEAAAEFYSILSLMLQDGLEEDDIELAMHLRSRSR